MRKHFIFHVILLLSVAYSYGQAIGIGSSVFTPDASAMLEVQATNKGVLIPRVSLTSFTDNVTIPNPATSLLVYNQGAAIPVGYYYNAGTPAAPQWVRILDHRHAWFLTGNAGTNPTTNFLGTTDAQPLVIRTNNTERMRILSSGEVGIGVLTPAQRLVVAGNIGLQAGANAFVGTLDNFALSLRTNNTDRVFITNTGNVGIGTTTPAAQLHTTGTVRFANYASGVNGAVLRTNNLGDLQITNFTGNATDVLLGNGTFGSMNAIAWLLTGNSGTDPATNFLGTTDNQHFAVRTNNVERMRFENDGQIVVNAPTAYSTYLFDIEGNATFANPLYVSTPVANGTGIVVENYAAAGAGTGGAIWGISLQTGWATAAFGLRSLSAYQNAAVSAITGSDVSNGIGVIGRCDNITGIGVIGYNLSTTANTQATGVWGQTPNPAGCGVLGANTSTTANINATGVWGQTSNPAGTGVYGVNSSTTPNNNAMGVMGSTSNPGGSGGVFIVNATTTTSDGYGVIGRTNQQNGIGVYGLNTSTIGPFGGIVGAGNNYTTVPTGTIAGGVGVIGTTNRSGTVGSTTGAGVYGNADGQYVYGVYGYTQTNSSGTAYGIFRNRGGVLGFTYYGNSYCFGVAGYRFDDTPNRTGGVLGGSSSAATPAAWGSLGYKASNNTHYGVYGSSAYASGGGFLSTNNCSGVGGGFYGNFIGTWSRGDVIGHITCGEAFASYNLGNQYTVGFQAQILPGNDKNVYAYTTTSTDLKVYDDGKARLNNGMAFVPFSDQFLALVGDEQPTITVTPIGQWSALYVSAITEKGFEVRDHLNPESQVEFHYVVIARRKDAHEAVIPSFVLEPRFNQRLKEYMHNESITTQDAKPLWWDGKQMRFDEIPQQPDTKPTITSVELKKHMDDEKLTQSRIKNSESITLKAIEKNLPLRNTHNQ